MKVLGIVGSPRKGGNTEILVNESLAAAASLGAEVELVSIVGKKVTPCDGCDACKKTSKCRIDDDMQAIYSKMLEADGIIFGSPTYFWGMTAQMKAVVDRTFSLMQGRRLRNKLAGAVVVGRRSGLSSAFGAFLDFFTMQRMVVASAAVADAGEEELEPAGRGGGVIALAGEKGEVRQDKRGMEEARELGKAMAKAIIQRDKGRA